MAAATQTDPSVTSPTLTVDVDVDGALVHLRARYDPRLIERMKALPGRRYVPDDTEWVLPARREALAALARLLVDRASVTQSARLRLERHGPGRLGLHDGEFEIRAAPRPRRLAKLRGLPERRWLVAEHCWRVPVTRAGALALAALVDDEELVRPRPPRGRLEQIAAAQPPEGQRAAVPPSAQRASPIAHWRHVARGPIFAPNPHRRDWVDGVGWCVRVRVDPGHRRPRSGT